MLEHSSPAAKYIVYSLYYKKTNYIQQQCLLTRSPSTSDSDAETQGEVFCDDDRDDEGPDKTRQETRTLKTQANDTVAQLVSLDQVLHLVMKAYLQYTIKITRIN